MSQRVLETQEDFDRAALALLPQLAGLSVLQAEAVLKEARRWLRHLSAFDGDLSSIPGLEEPGPASG